MKTIDGVGNMRMCSIMVKIFMLAAVVSMWSCSATRYIGDDEYLLNRSTIIPDSQTPKKERITAEELDRFVRQVPVAKLMGTNLRLSVYSMSDTTKHNWLNNLLRKIGTPPVIMDSTQIDRSQKNIERYLNSRGYFESDVTCSVDVKRHKAHTKYVITQGPPYRIRDVKYDFRDEFIKPVVAMDTVNSLIRRGDVFDMNVLDSERSRISGYMRDRGYFNFSVNNIHYLADSMVDGRYVDVTMVVKQHLTGYGGRGEQIYENNALYRVSSIAINTNFNPNLASTDADYYRNLDTVKYRGLDIIHDGKLNVREKILRRTINLYPNYLYSDVETKNTYSNIMRLGYFRSANIVFTDVSDSTQQNLVTFIGDDNESGETTRENYLACVINCIPAYKQSYKIDLETSMSTNFYGLGATVGYQNRNLLGGAELFNASVSGRYEFTRIEKNDTKVAFEMGASVSLAVPRFVSLINFDRKNKLNNPRTRLELMMTSQKRPQYNRTLLGTKFSYSWSDNKRSSFIVRPADVNLILMRDVDSEFIEGLNKYLRDSYTEQLVAGASASYVYNSQLRHLDWNSNSLMLRVNAESMGNILNGISKLFLTPIKGDGEEFYEVFRVRFAQYLRTDITFSQRFQLSQKTTLAYRLMGGVGFSYGNTKAIPSDRLFTAGGSNSMRGWIPRTLGPGSEPAVQKSAYPFQAGNMKLEANVEYRFPIWGFLHGAMFFDVGNIWYTSAKGYEIGSEAVFDPARFLKELGFNTGAGLRLDFSRFIIRADWGVQLHNPNLPVGKRWISRFDWDGTSLNIGVGYPF